MASQLSTIPLVNEVSPIAYVFAGNKKTGTLFFGSIDTSMLVSRTSEDVLKLFYTTHKGSEPTAEESAKFLKDNQLFLLAKVSSVIKYSANLN